MKVPIFYKKLHNTQEQAKSYDPKFFLKYSYQNSFELVKTISKMKEEKFLIFTPNLILPLLPFLFTKKYFFYILHEPKLNLKRSSYFNYLLITLWNFLCSFGVKFIFVSNNGYNLAKNNRFILKKSYKKKIVTSLFGRPEIKQTAEKIKYDFILWGIITKDKGLQTFLKVSEQMPDKRFAILTRNKDLLSLDTSKYLNLTLIIKDAFIPEDEIESFVASGKVALMPQIDGAQSGCLPVALRQHKPVLAFDRGSFKEFLLQTEDNISAGIVVKYSKDKQKNIIELVKAAQNIIDNYSSFSEDARKIYHLKFNAQTESEKIYKNILSFP